MTLSSPLVGQVGNLRPIVNRPGAGPEEIFRARHETRTDRVHFYVSPDTPKLLGVPHHPVIALILPERLSSKFQNSVRLTSRESLQRLHYFREVDSGCDEHMDMVRHDNPRMQLIAFHGLSMVLDRVDHQPGDRRLTKIHRAGAGLIEQTVHSREGFAGRCRLGKTSVRGQTAGEAPSNEDRAADRVNMRESASVAGNHKTEVHSRSENSPLKTPGRLTIGRRLPTCPTSERH